MLLPWLASAPLVCASLLALAGHSFADRYHEIARYLDPATLVLRLIVIVYFSRLVTYRTGGKSP
jgi:hypothetical protein